MKHLKQAPWYIKILGRFHRTHSTIVIEGQLWEYLLCFKVIFGQPYQVSYSLMPPEHVNCLCTLATMETE